MTRRRLQLLLYGRPRCHLCDVAKEALRLVLAAHPVDLVERNVEDDPAWEREFGESIPVGILEGRRVFKYRVDPHRLELAILARLSRSDGGAPGS